MTTATPATPATPAPATAPVVQPAAGTPPAAPAVTPAATPPAAGTPPAPGTPPATPPSTGIEGIGEAPAAGATGDFPDNWRELLAGGDAKKLDTLKRYTSPTAFNDAYFALRQKMSSGDFKTVLKEGSTAEETAAWRKDNGIPDAPTGYDVKLSDGLVLGEQDKAIADAYKPVAHQLNLTPAQYNAGVEFLLQQQQQAEGDQHTADMTKWKETENSLRAEWGKEYDLTQKTTVGYLDTILGEDGRKAFLAARMPDGTKLGGNGQIVRALAQIARENIGGVYIPPGTDGSSLPGIEQEMAGIEKRMGTTSYTDADRTRWMELSQIKTKIAPAA